MLAPVLVGYFGVIVERYGLRNIHKYGHIAELLFTFGLFYIIEEMVQLIWGKTPVPYKVPEILNFPLIEISGLSYPCLLYTSPSPRDLSTSRMPSSA